MSAAGKRRAAVLMLAYVFGGIALAAAMAAALVHWARGADGAIATWLAEERPDRIARRLMQLWAVILFFPLIRYLGGWVGWGGIGWTSSVPGWTWRSALRAAAIGALAGVLSLLLVCVVYRLGGQTAAGAGRGLGALLAYVGEVAVAGIAVGLIEETCLRGVLFFTFARIWSRPAAVVTTALFFAFVHFPSPDPAAFDVVGFLGRWWAVFSSTLATIPATEFFAMRFLNLTLIGVLLGVVVMRTGTIWTGVGLHAGWIWVIKINKRLTSAGDRDGYPLFGSSNMDDSLLVTFALAVLLVGALRLRDRGPVLAWLRGTPSP